MHRLFAMFAPCPLAKSCNIVFTGIVCSSPCLLRPGSTSRARDVTTAITLHEAEVESSPKRKRLEPPGIVHSGSCIQPSDEIWQNAAILIDKDSSWTSHDVCSKLKGMLRLKKIGHAGTLDPSATGLLILCTGKGTKSIDRFVAQEKEYTGVMQLGSSTPSYDRETEVDCSLPWEHLTDEDLERAARHFTGSQMQMPPMYSALKVKGERLYFAARKGLEVERQPRAIHISSLTLERDNHLKQEGLFLGSVAYMSSLRRERIGNHKVADAWKISELDAALKSSKAAQ